MCCCYRCVLHSAPLAPLPALLLPSPQVTSALAYYLGLRYIPDSQVVNELLGVPTHLLHSIVDVSGEGGRYWCVNVQQPAGIPAPVTRDVLDLTCSTAPHNSCFVGPRQGPEGRLLLTALGSSEVRGQCGLTETLGGQ